MDPRQQKMKAGDSAGPAHCQQEYSNEGLSGSPSLLGPTPGGRHGRPCAGDVVRWRWTAQATRGRLHGRASEIGKSRLSQASKQHLRLVVDGRGHAPLGAAEGFRPLSSTHLAGRAAGSTGSLVVAPGLHCHLRPGQDESSSGANIEI